MVLSISKIIRLAERMEGSKGALSLSGKQLRMLAEKDDTIKALINGMKEPTLDVAYKAKSNYNVAAFRLKDGKKAIANGAVSLQNPGTAESIIKYRLNVGENGKIVRTNGFADLGKSPDIDNFGTALSKRNGVISASADSGDAFRLAAEIKQDDAIEMASRFSGVSEDVIGRGTFGVLAKDANKLQTKWKQLREFFTVPQQSSARVSRIADSDAAKTIVSNEFDLKKIWGVSEEELLTRLDKLSKKDFDEFQKIKKEMGEYGFQPFFNPKTGNLKIMYGAKNIDEVAKKLKQV